MLRISVWALDHFGEDFSCLVNGRGGEAPTCLLLLLVVLVRPRFRVRFLGSGKMLMVLNSINLPGAFEMGRVVVVVSQPLWTLAM